MSGSRSFVLAITDPDLPQTLNFDFSLKLERNSPQYRAIADLQSLSGSEVTRRVKGSFKS